MKYVFAFGGTAIAFLIIDLVWLGIVAKGFYRSQLADFIGPVVIPAAAAFYILYVIAIVIFAVAPALQSGSWKTAALYGALFGFFAYMTYDLTNLATLKDWPVKLVFVDIAWGTVLTASCATAGYFVASRFG